MSVIDKSRTRHDIESYCTCPAHIGDRLRVEPPEQESRSENNEYIVLKPNDLDKMIDLALDIVYITPIEQYEEVLGKSSEFVRDNIKTIIDDAENRDARED